MLQICSINIEAVVRSCSVKIIFLKVSYNSQESTYVGVSFSKNSAPQADLKETPTQVLSCEFCKIFKNNYFEELLRMAAY